MTDTRHPPIDRRTPSSDLLLLVQEVKDSQELMSDQLKKVPEEIAKALAVLMSDAFPNGDPDGHKRYHEAGIKKAEEQAAFWAKLKMELAKYGLLGFMGWAAWAAGQALLVWIQSGGKVHP